MTEQSSQAWLSIVGIGENGLKDLSAEALSWIEQADYLVAGKRHLSMVPEALSPKAERMSWPSPFSSTFSVLRGLEGNQVVILATGDPMHCGIGGTLTRFFGAEEMRALPAVGAYSLVASRMRWPLDKCRLLTIHGRNPARLLPHLMPSERLIILSKDGKSPHLVAEQLCAIGAQAAEISILENLGGKTEKVQHFTAGAICKADEKPVFGPLNSIAVKLPASGFHWLPTTAGLPDDAFAHDGKLTKQDIRASALAKLMPQPGGLLWDVGAGCGSVGIEWMRTDPTCRAIGLEPQAKRRAYASENALALGTPGLKLVDGIAPEALQDLEVPDAIFVGGGLSSETLTCCLAALKPGGRLVAHAVTLGSEALLLAMFEAHAGQLTRLSITKASRVGPHHGWRAAMPVTQWCYVKPFEGGEEEI